APRAVTFITRRDVLIDGVSRAIASSVSRADYCATNPVRGCPFVGFQSDLNLSALNLTPGSHTVSGGATNNRGAFKDSDPVSFFVDLGQGRVPQGTIETPVTGAEVSGPVAFRGYA